MLFLASLFVLKSKSILIAVNVDPKIINDLSFFVKKLLLVKFEETFLGEYYLQINLELSQI